MITLFSCFEGRRWTATGALTSRRGPDERSLALPLSENGKGTMTPFLVPYILQFSVGSSGQEVGAAEKVCEARVATERIEHRVWFYVSDAYYRAILKGLF